MCCPLLWWRLCRDPVQHSAFASNPRLLLPTLQMWFWAFLVFLYLFVQNFPQPCRHAVIFQFSSVQSLSHVQLFVTPLTAARQASLSITNSRSPPKPMSIESVMPSSHLILCQACPFLLLPSIFPSIRVFSSKSALSIRWPNYLEFQLQHQSFQ